jgi:hypothetical protein
MTDCKKCGEAFGFPPGIIQEIYEKNTLTVYCGCADGDAAIKEAKLKAVLEDKPVPFCITNEYLERMLDVEINKTD